MNSKSRFHNLGPWVARDGPPRRTEVLKPLQDFPAIGG